MYLKRLEICGFKSFAEKTVLNFDDGVTCIVGPNGCGKSNISDAIRWVLGEKSTKMLRGSKMQDMIFNGTEFRKPMGFCEVTIVFSNEDKSLPVDYPEVAITRKYFREGESQYMINKNICRQRDIYDLFMDTGVGSNSYCMVEQGRIDYIVKASPEHRRFLIEEAAGISKFKNKKDEALRKLERTQNNLLRINDIIAEVEKNIKYAERQAKKAEKYKNQYDNLKRLETYHAVQTIDNVEDFKQEVDKKKKEAEDLQEKFLFSVSELKTKLGRKNQELEDVNQEIKQFEESKYLAVNERDRLKDKLEFNQIRIQELKTRNEACQINIDEKHKKIEEAQVLIEERQSAFETFTKELEAEESQFESKQFLYNQLQSDIMMFQSELERLESEEYEIASQISQIENETSRAEVELSSIQTRIAELKESAEKKTAIKDEKEREISELNQKIEEAKRSLQEKEEKLNRDKEDKQRMSSELESIHNEIVSKQLKQKEVQARLEMIKELDQQFEGFDSAAKELLKRRDEGDERLRHVQTLDKWLKVKPGYEKAIETVLSNEIYSLVTHDHQEAFRILKLIKEEDLGGLQLIVGRRDLSSRLIYYPDHVVVVGKAMDYIEVADEHRQLFEALLSKTLIIRSDWQNYQEKIIELSKDFRLITLEGVVFGPGIFVSSNKVSQNSEMGVFSRDSQRQEMTQSLQSLESHLAGLEFKKNELSQKLQTLSQQIESHTHDLHENKVAFQSLSSRHDSLKNSIEQLLSEIQYSHNEVATANQKILQFEKKMEEGEAAITELRESRAVLEDQILTEKEKLAENLPKKEELQIELASFKVKLEGLRQKKDFLHSEIQTLNKSCQDEEGLLQRLKEEITQNLQNITDLESDTVSSKERIEEIVQNLTEIEKQLEEKSITKTAVSKELQKINQELESCNQELEKCRSQIHDAEKKAMDFNYQKKSVIERMLQKYSIDLTQIDVSSIEVTEDEKNQLSGLIEKLSNSVEKLGTVNLLAVDEYEELKERYEFLVTHRSDLETGRDTLLEAIRKINRTTKKLYIDVFHQINKTFNEYYKILFKGGYAELIMVDEENPLESGIDIFVRPPGKALQNISLLSGGEKALTAISLLMSVFKVKPSPYCVLDEVDAPLDEANIERFVDVLKEFTSTTQFLIVTHSRKTIAIGQTLFGITMEEPGCSKVVSVKIGEEDKFLDDTKKEDKREGIYKPKNKYDMKKVDELVGTNN